MELEYLEFDLDADGTISKFEFDRTGLGEEDDFEEFDINLDEKLQFNEALNAFCTCENELEIVWSEMSSDSDLVSVKALMNHEWLNQFDFEAIEGSIKFNYWYYLWSSLLRRSSCFKKMYYLSIHLKKRRW